MAVRKVLIFPDIRLRKVAEPVRHTPGEPLSEDIQNIITDMFETMYHYNGGGLAATQIDVHSQIMVMDWSKNPELPDKQVFINLEILEKRGSEIGPEGCISIPEVYADIERAAWIRARYIDEQGQAQEIETDGILARCIQHELDHLQGKMFVDYLSDFKRRRIADKMRKLQKVRN